jgi:hypothetical protein
VSMHLPALSGRVAPTASAEELDPTPIVRGIEWTRWDRCPVCNSPHEHVVKLSRYGRHFATSESAPPAPVAVASCRSCRLVYKTLVPSRESLPRLRDDDGSNELFPYDVEGHLADLRQIAGDEPVELLAIGEHDDRLLGEWQRRACGGHISVLRSGRHAPAGAELIRGTLDADLSRISKRRYHIATIADSISALYAPRMAFQNLRTLLRDGGFAVIEAGNPDGARASLRGLSQWPYANSLQRHTFWNRPALASIAAEFGFRMLIWRELPTSPRASKSPWRRLGYSSPRDRFRIILRKAT